MKPRPVLITLAALLAVAGLAHFFRYQLVAGPAEAFAVYRLDRLTGRVEYSVGAGQWEQLGARK